jgi:hypothetical protein
MPERYGRLSEVTRCVVDLTELASFRVCMPFSWLDLILSCRILYAHVRILRFHVQLPKKHQSHKIIKTQSSTKRSIDPSILQSIHHSTDR